MTEAAVSDVKIQACKGGCGGLWFDEWTLRKVDQPDQSAGEALLHIEQNAAVKLDPEKRRNCPRDAGIVMMRHFWSVKRDVVVDERSEEHTSELQSRPHLVCRLLLEKKKRRDNIPPTVALRKSHNRNTTCTLRQAE